MKFFIKASMAALAVLAFGVAAQPSQPHPAKPAFPQIELPEKARGLRAIQLLGARLPEVAAWYGKTPAEFAAILRRDQMAWIDRSGRMLYEEEVQPPLEAGTATGDSLTQTGALAPLDQTFKLNSRPGAKRTIYLDFDGATLSGTVWNSSQQSITAVPFDLDGVPYSFSSTELQRIQMIWQRVAEDYAPFDVNVTTQVPASGALSRSSSSDDTFGTTVLITKNTFYSCSCGGVAYLGVFDDTTDSRKPALVFYDGLGGGNEKYVADAITHEAGHNMGLNHDGTSSAGYYTGHNGWAPIMGVGYYQSLVQWSKGEYASANNKEDDYVVMAANGLPLRADDHGNTTGGATALAGTTAGGVTTLVGGGVIERPTDLDVFSFVAAAGTLNVAVNPAARSANLDLRVDLMDGSGKVLATASPADALNGALTFSAPTGGTFFVAVRGTGKGDLTTGYSNYGSLGEYRVSVSVPTSASQPPVAVLSAAPTSGVAPLAVSFSASGSSDPDGSIASVEWNFGDGSPLAYGVTASRTYSNPGTYTATVKVTDNAGLSSVKSVSITASGSTTSQPPVVALAAAPTSGAVALPVSFSASGSYDPDGSVASIEWNFGDGSPLAYGVTANRTYSTPGTYTASVKVTDNAGLSSIKKVTITANDPNVASTNTMSVAGITVTLNTNRGGNTEAYASVSIRDSTGNPVSGATVSGSWSGVVSGSGGGTTDTSGVAQIKSPRTKSTGQFIFTVDNVTRSGYSYVSGNNTENSDSATR